MLLSLVPMSLALLLSLLLLSFQVHDNERRELERALALRTTQLQDANHTIRRISTHDTLTGLFNKRGFRDLLRRELIRSQRINSPVVVMTLYFQSEEPVDPVKRYSMMSVLGKRLTQWTRETDVFARISDEVLAFVLLDTEESGGRVFLERLQSHLMECSFQFPPFSVGMASCPDQGDSADALINGAIAAARTVAPGEVAVMEKPPETEEAG